MTWRKTNTAFLTSTRRRSHITVFAAAMMFAAGCVHHKPGETGGVDLAGYDTPVYTIEASDASEIAILVQKFNLDVVSRSGGALTFRAPATVLSELENFGYAVTSPNPGRVQTRVVRLLRAGAEEPDFGKLGVTFINREENYWVVSGDLVTLRGLVEQGWSIAPVEGDEPRPRPIIVRVQNLDDLERLKTTGMEIWTAFPDDPAWERVIKRPTNNEFGPQEYVDVEATLAARRRLWLTSPILVEGAAFDAQIDEIEALGFSYERN